MASLGLAAVTHDESRLLAAAVLWLVLEQKVGHCQHWDVWCACTSMTCLQAQGATAGVRVTSQCQQQVQPNILLAGSQSNNVADCCGCPAGGL